MQLAVKNFAKSKENGLCLIEMPTGTGKTYETRQLIKKYLLGEELQNIKRIIYLTPLKKNLDEIYDKLKSELSDDELFNNNVLRLYSNLESIQYNLLSVDSKIPQNLKFKDSYKTLKTSLRIINNEYIDKETRDSVINSIRSDYEFKFRTDLKKEIFKNVKSPKEKMNIINNDFSWVKDIYPSCLIDNRKVLFMTMDKFLYPNDPIIKDPYSFNNKEFLENSLIFIDEFDSTKDKILNKEIEKCTNYKIDIARFYSCLIDSINTRKIPEDAFANSEISKNSFYEMLKKANELKDEYHLDYVFKLKTEEDTQNYFLFDDYKIHTIHSEDLSKPLSVKIDTNKKQNIISINKNGSSESFYLMINRMTSFLNYFIKCCYILSTNYMINYNNNLSTIDRMTMDESASTIIDYFGFDEKMSERLVSLIIGESASIKHRKIIGISDFYMDGFKYFDFEDHLSHDMSTRIAASYLDCTPEKYIISLAQTTRIVGLSATATMETVTGNYDLKYVKKILKNDFYSLNESEQNELNNIVNEKLSTNYPINFERISIISESLNKIVSNLFESDALIERYVGIFEKYVRHNDKNPYFDIERMIKIYISIKKFILLNDSKVLLILTNQIVKDNSDDIFTKKNIEKVISDIAFDQGINDIPKLHYLFGDMFDKEKNQYFDEVKLGNKVIIFSSYNSIGTGQNLQYRIEIDGVEFEKDIDSLYLERPTHLIVHSDSFYNDSSLVKYIYQMEALRASNNIHPNISIQCIKSAFKKRLNEKDGFISNEVYDCKSTNNHQIKILIQAVGRICRTREKDLNQNVNLFVDNEIIDKIDFSIMSGKLMNPEFKMICGSSNYINSSYTQTNEYLNEAIKNNLIIEQKINSLLSHNNTKWNQDDIDKWLLIREIVLKHPTISYEKLNELSHIDGLQDISDFYLKSNNGTKIYSYVYNKINNKVFYITDDYKRSNEDIIIDYKNCRLKNIVANQMVFKYFTEMGYATEFQKNDCIILPVVFQNIYKGALGEVAGKLILENNVGIKLDEIIDPSKFEKFDFVCHDNKDVYVDFKNWNDNDKEDRDKNVCHSLDKLSKINGKKAFIINIISDKSFKIHEKDNIIEIPSVYNWKNNYFTSYTDYKQIREYFKDVIENGNK